MALTQKTPEDPVFSSLYRVFLGGKEIPVFFCRVSAVPYNTSWPGMQRPVDQTEEAAFVCLTAEGGLSLDIDLSNELFEEPLDEEDDVVVRPLSSGAKAFVTGGYSVRLTVPGPGYYTLEIDGPANCLQVFADPAETLIYREEAKGATYRFENGVFDAGTITLNSGESLYIGEDAIVYGTVDAKDAKNVRVFGRGILDNSRVKRYDGSCLKYGAMHITNCENVTVEGIVFRDSSTWTATVIQSENVTFRNVKITGMWRYNTDGIDLVNSRNCVIENCFLRDFDDAVVLKGLKGFDTRNVENIYVSKCVIWCDWGRAIEIGAETCADEYRNIVFEDCDIIHGDCILMDLQNGDRASVHGVTFKNIRCEYSAYQQKPVYQSDMGVPYPAAGELFIPVLFKAHLYCGLWSDDMIYGENRDILLEDIKIIADDEVPMPEIVLEGVNEEHRTYGIRIKNMSLNGVKLDKDDLNVKLGAFAEFPEVTD